jgi:dethiobiotin synthetase
VPPINRLFITGTDTDVGKTEVAVALLQLARQAGLSTAAMKPVAAGCELIDGEWKNNDALRLQAQCSLPLSYGEVNPVALKKAIAPHLAAYDEKKTITIERLIGLTQNILNKKADFTVIEGAGGWRVPISHRELLSQYAKELKLPVLMVVGVQLGCLNHSLLTAEAIMNDGLTIAGWVANIIDKNMVAAEENIQTLQHFLPGPCIGVIPFQQNPSTDMFASFLKPQGALF